METKRCRVYWGSHGCRFLRNHEGNCECDCCTCSRKWKCEEDCVAKYPYYGPNTKFYGEDAQRRGLPTAEVS
jgi:hypothetical protein